MSGPAPHRLPRREAIQWMLAATATAALLDLRSLGAPAVPARGYGADPDLTAAYKPGELWPLTFTDSQRRTASALCDVIIPADGLSPAASAVHVVDFLDEWVSAPYELQQTHGKLILEGLAWIEAESRLRYEKKFADLDEAGQHSICDDICHVPRAAPRFKTAAVFFALFRNLTASGFYTTPAGWKDIGYVGNTALERFDGPPPAVLKHVGLA